MMKIGTLFSGFGGVDIGAMAAGLQSLWGIEYDPAIAAVARQNISNHYMIADILDVAPATLAKVDVLHASPPCPNFSLAKTNGTETELDIALANKVVGFIRVIEPRIFTLENVYGYRRSESWRIINDALYECGYWVSMEHVNAADFGVPQTRKRMIVRAVRGGWVPMLPQPEPWVGWYEAIKDLIPGLPDSRFAPWQLARLPEEWRTMLLAQGSYGAEIVNAREDDPSFTITSNGNQTNIKAILVPGDNNTVSYADTPRFLCDGSGNKNFSEVTYRLEGEPMVTLRASDYKRPCRAYDGRRVVSMTTRCLARFQSFPDSYVLPEQKTLAAKGIGNAVPPLLYQKIISQLLQT